MLPKIDKETITIHDNTIAINFCKLSDKDLIKVLSSRNQYEVRKWMYNKEIISLKDHMAFVENLEKDNKNKYWASYDENLNIIGVIYLNNINLLNNGFAELGIYKNTLITEKGIGSRLINLLFKIAFEEIGLRKLYLEVFKVNEVAVDFYKKHGFIECGVLKNHVNYLNNFTDVIIMEKFCESEDKNIK